MLYKNLPTILPASPDQPKVADDPGGYIDPLVRMTLRVDAAMREQTPANWKGDEVKERQVQNVLYDVLDRDREATEVVFELVKNMKGY